MDGYPIIIAALIASISAIIGAAFGYLASNRVSSRTSNLEIAKFRQQWINDLRTKMKDFYKAGRALGSMSFEHTNFYELQNEVDALRDEIRLMMNPDDPDYDLLDVHLQIYANDLNEYAQTNLLAGREFDFIRLSQRILKREWEVLKKEVKK